MERAHETPSLAADCYSRQIDDRGPSRRVDSRKIFYFYKLACRRSYGGPKEWEWEWHKLAHVCRKWRTVVFASQRRLDLRLLCTPKTSIQQTLDLWPAFPIIVMYTWSLDGWDNTIAALQHRNRAAKLTSISYRCQCGSIAAQSRAQ